MSMVQVYQHPQFDDVRVNVPDGDGQRWRDQGWRRVSKDKAPAPRQETGTVELGATAADTPEPVPARE